MVLAITDMDKLPSTCGECNLCYDNEMCMARCDTEITMIGTRPSTCPLIESEGSTNGSVR